MGSPWAETFSPWEWGVGHASVCLTLLHPLLRPGLRVLRQPFCSGTGPTKCPRPGYCPSDVTSVPSLGSAQGVTSSCPMASQPPWVGQLPRRVPWTISPMPHLHMGQKSEMGHQHELTGPGATPCPFPTSPGAKEQTWQNPALTGSRRESCRPIPSPNRSLPTKTLRGAWRGSLGSAALRGLSLGLT